MSSAYGPGSGQGSSAGGPGQGGYDQGGYGSGGYDPGAPQGVPPVGGTQGYPGVGSTPDPTGAGYSEAGYGASYSAGAPQGGATSSYDTNYAPGTETGGASAAPSDRPDVEDVSVGSLVGRLTGDVSKLMRQELELAKAELREEGKKAGKAAGLLGGAALAGLLVAILASFTLIWALDDQIPLWLAALIVTLLWAVLGAILYAMGRKKLAEVNKPEQTIETLKEDKQWVQAQKN